MVSHSEIRLNLIEGIIFKVADSAFFAVNQLLLHGNKQLVPVHRDRVNADRLPCSNLDGGVAADGQPIQVRETLNSMGAVIQLTESQRKDA